MSMSINENNDETCDNDGPKPWSDLNHDVLHLVMMQLGVVDFVAFSGVCMSWRSLALFNRNEFILSKPPMSIRIPTESNKKDCYCYLEDFEGRKFKTIIPHSAGRECVGFTCGYLVLFGNKTRDFWVVNPITRHELHFPDIPSVENYDPTRITATLVFSPSIGLVFLILYRFTSTILFSVEGTRSWDHVTFIFSVHDLYAYRGKIYTINHQRLCELKLVLEPKLTLLETKNYTKPDLCVGRFFCSVENLYVISLILGSSYKLHELDLGETEWVSVETSDKSLKEIFAKYDSFNSRDLKYGFTVKPELWADLSSQFERYASFLDTTNKSRKAGSLLRTSGTSP